MSQVMMIAPLVVLVASALGVAVFRDGRWSVLAWWLNALAAGLLMLRLGAELLFFSMLLGSTLTAVAYFLHVDSLSRLVGREKKAGRFEISAMVLPFLVSMGAAVILVRLFSLVFQEAGHGLVSTAGSTSDRTESNFVAFQLVAFCCLLVAVGSGVIARPKRRSHD
ncbi:MAG: hypothetical protein RJB38_1959 [Pseudomonadota bacterium]|jgi:hypothetical protein